MSKTYYLTTAIAYTSGKPHIGNTYEAILADSIVRFKRQQGYDVRFQTGTDEHGQKIELKAAEAGITSEEAPQSGTALQAVETPQPEMTMNEIERVMANMMSVLKDKNATADALHKRFSRRTDMTVDHCIPYSSDRKYSGVPF